MRKLRTGDWTNITKKSYMKKTTLDAPEKQNTLKSLLWNKNTKNVSQNWISQPQIEKKKIIDTTHKNCTYHTRHNVIFRQFNPDVLPTVKIILFTQERRILQIYIMASEDQFMWRFIFRSLFVHLIRGSSQLQCFHVG